MYRAAAMIASRSSPGLLVAATCAAGGVGAAGCLVLLPARVDRDRAGGSTTTAAPATSSTATALATSSTTTTTTSFAAFASSSSSSSSSSSPSSPSSPLRDLLDDLEVRRSLIVPAAEALLRAARLVGTAAVLAADYRLDLALRRHPIVPAAIARALGSNVGGDGEEEEEGDRRRIAIELEGTIERLERDLDGAQRTYAESGVDRRERSPLGKRREKEAMLSIAGDLAAAREESSSLLSAAGGARSNNNDCCVCPSRVVSSSELSLLFCLFHCTHLSALLLLLSIISILLFRTGGCNPGNGEPPVILKCSSS